MVELRAQIPSSTQLNIQETHPFSGRNGTLCQPMDMTWITDRIAIGGGIETAENMQLVAQAGVTHIIDMQIEFDDTGLARAHKIRVLWNGIYNDFQPKPPELFQRGVDFGLAALAKQRAKLLIHCTLGMHRAPAMALALLCAMGWPLEVAMQVIQKCRPVVYFADAYVESVKAFLAGWPGISGAGTEAKALSKYVGPPTESNGFEPCLEARDPG